MWETLGIAGTALGGVGQFMGGASQLFGGGSAQKMYSGKTHKQQIKNTYKASLEAAAKFGPRYGFHPLTALGINPSSGGRFQQVGADFGSMGQGLERSLSALSKLDPAIKEARGVRLQQEAERLKNMKLQNQALEKKIQDADTQTGPTGRDIKTDQFGVTVEELSPPKMPQQGHKYVQREIPASSSLGMKSGVSPGLEGSVDPWGFFTPDISQERAESLDADWWEKFTVGIKKFGRWLQGIGTRPGINLYNYAIKIHPDIKPKKGQMWMFNLWHGKWQMVKATPQRRKMKATKNPWIY